MSKEILHEKANMITDRITDMINEELKNYNNNETFVVLAILLVRLTSAFLSTYHEVDIDQFLNKFCSDIKKLDLIKRQ